jgi:predicted aspartyl protease
VQVEALAAGGSWRQVRLLVDTGADMTVLDGETVQALGLPLETADGSLTGVGGGAALVVVSTTLQMARADGGAPLTFKGRFAAVDNPVELGTGVLGRDILNLFTLIVDRASEAVQLLRPPHRYTVHPA